MLDGSSGIVKKRVSICHKRRDIIFQKTSIFCSMKQKELGHELRTIKEVRCSLGTGVASRAAKHKGFFFCRSERLALKP